MTEQGVLAVVGSINVDTTLHVERIPVAGETILSRDRLVSPGGKGANQATAAAAAGSSVHFICAIGGLDEAASALSNLRTAKVDLAGVQEIEDEVTGSAIVVVGSDAENLIIVDLGANARLDARHVRARLHTIQPDVILTQLETPLEVAHECASFSGAAWRILNPAPMSSAVPAEELLAGFNIIIPNRTELGQLVDQPEPDSLASVIDCVNALSFDGVIVVTLGADGAALFLSPNAEPVVFPPPQVAPVDTSGAGDVFCGVFASELAAHGNLQRAVEAAVQMSALSTERRGAQLSLDEVGAGESGSA